MSPRRAIVVLAMLAALVVAPSSVFAAANELHNPLVLPPLGTTETLFVMSVGYHSSAGNPADSVTASVAGKSVTLWLTAGTAVDGTWSGTTTLPAGSWMVTFRASASRGSDPSVSIGPVSVAQIVTASPSSQASNLPPGDTAESDDPSTTAVPKPLPSTEPSTSDPAPAAGGKAAKASGGAAPSASDTADPGRLGPGRTPNRRSPAPDASSSPAGAAATTEPTAGKSDGGKPAVDGELVGTVLLIGIVSVAGVALLGAAWIIIASRRDRPEPSIVVAPPIEAAVAAIPTVEQRARRRARLRPSDDPILAALGLNDEEPLTPSGGQGDQGVSKRRFRRAARDTRPES